MADLYAHVNHTAKLHSSLPRVKLPAGQSRSPNLQNSLLGSTKERLGPDNAPAMVDVVGQPSIKVTPNVGPGVVTSVRRNSKYTEFIQDRDLDGVRSIGRQMLGKAKVLSKGTLSTQQQIRMNHPFGHGTHTPGGSKRRQLGRTTRVRGASNKSVVNWQTGKFYDSWELQFIRGKEGVTLLLINTSPQAEYLAFGTKRMIAHGPFTTAPALFLHALNVEWAKQSKRAYHREMALRGSN